MLALYVRGTFVISDTAVPDSLHDYRILDTFEHRNYLDFWECCIINYINLVVAPPCGQNG